MLSIKSKKITLPLCLCAISMLFTSTLALAASSTGDVAALRAAEQRAALAKKAAEKQAAKEAAEKKAAEEQKDAAEAQTPAEEKKEK